MNKKLLVAGFIFLGFWRFGYAEAKPRFGGVFMPDPGSFSSEAVYISSAINIVGTFQISSHTGFLYSLIITSGSVAESTPTVTLYDSRVSASSLGAVVLPGGARPISNQVSATSMNQFIYNIGLSSGLIAVVHGIPAPSLNLIYLER